MAEAVFVDNLYGYSPALRGKGAGQVAFVRCAFWHYERHAAGCTPGKWRVSVGGHDAGSFWPLVAHETDAVVDDFGALVPVGVQ